MVDGMYDSQPRRNVRSLSQRPHLLGLTLFDVFGQFFTVQ
jgi:hypothetical protein